LVKWIYEVDVDEWLWSFLWWCYDATWLLLWYVDNVYVDAIMLHDYCYDMLMIWCYMIYDMMLHVYDDDMVLYVYDMICWWSLSC
jgi:hypothetical protein